MSDTITRGALRTRKHRPILAAAILLVAGAPGLAVARHAHHAPKHVGDASATPPAAAHGTAGAPASNPGAAAHSAPPPSPTGGAPPVGAPGVTPANGEAPANAGAPKGPHRGPSGGPNAEPSAPARNADRTRGGPSPFGPTLHGGTTVPHIDLTTPDGGYGARSILSTAKGENHPRNAPPSVVRKPADLHREPHLSLMPTRNAIGAHADRVGPIAGPALHDSTVTAIGTPLARLPQARGGSAAAPAVAPNAGLGTAAGTAALGRPETGHAVAPPIGGVPKTAMGISGTGMVRPGIGPASIGGAKTTSGIGGIPMRPRH